MAIHKNKKDKKRSEAFLHHFLSYFNFKLFLFEEEFFPSIIFMEIKEMK